MSNRITLEDIKGNPEGRMDARLINVRDLLEIAAFQLGEIGYDLLALTLDGCVVDLDLHIEETVEGDGS